jgi:predicted O-methyltransferase YrrM
MNKLMRWPGHLVGALEYHIRPRVGEVWGGPFNGQCFRQLIVADLLRVCEPAAIVETGTYRGSSTFFLAMNSPGRIFSTEANPRNFSFALRRLRHFQNVTLFYMDSREFLKNLESANLR